MKQTNALAYLRQICCSGLAKEVVITEFLRALHQVLPSGRNYFTSLDEQFNVNYQIADYIIPEMIALAEVAAFIIPDTWSEKNRLMYKAWYKQYPTLSDPSLIIKNWYQQDLYNLIHRKMDQHHILDVRVMNQGQLVGLIDLTRPLSPQPFNNREQALTVRLTPYIAHALQAQVDGDIPYIDSGLSALVIMDTQGAIVYLSDSAKQLLALSRYPETEGPGKANDDPVVAHLKQLCRQLLAIFEDKEAAPPNWSHSNVHGRFNFRAYWLDRQNPGSAGLIGMVIDHQEAQQLKILRALHQLPLSPVQKEVAALLAQGFSSEKIGLRLHIKLTTVKDHVRKIFTKLDIHRREELLPKLLAMESSTRIIGGVPFSYIRKH